MRMEGKYRCAGWSKGREYLRVKNISVIDDGGTTGRRDVYSQSPSEAKVSKIGGSGNALHNDTGM